MTLPASGAIAFSDINTELGYSSTAQVSLNDSAVRTLFGQASGSVDMNTGHGKASGVTVCYYIVAGGGGASIYNGGGGAGGYVHGSQLISGTATATVGAGGGGGFMDYTCGYASARGGNSYLSGSGFSFQACGGGNAGTAASGGSFLQGGSGGGARDCYHYADSGPGLGTSGQGTNGHYPLSRYRTGGGGGACLCCTSRGSSQGIAGVIIPCAYGYSDYRNYFTFGASNSYSGLKVAGGGAGFNNSDERYTTTCAIFGGGQFFHHAVCGTGGGAQGYYSVGRGASGTIVVRYPGCAKFTGGNIIYQNAGYTYHQFLTSGYLTPTTNPKVGGSWYLFGNACYTWYAPSGVTSVSVVAIAGGAAGYNAYNTYNSTGGGGGGLGWRNNISVSPGTGYTVRVGYCYGSNGDSYFINRCTVAGYGASRQANAYSISYGGGYTGDGDGYGGNGGNTTYCGYNGIGGPSGGGGAGGYTGNGGHGGNYACSCKFGASGSGGGGAGGQAYAAQNGGRQWGGGGTGVWGQGRSGVGRPNSGFNNYINGRWHAEGSFGVPITPSYFCINIRPGDGGRHGGGGAGSSCPRYFPGAGGGQGAVHIVWPGNIRQFPNLV
jgi:hypothetical protein